MSKINVWVHLEKDIATPLPGDDAEGVKEGLYWTAVPRSGDRCLGAMPIIYGDVQRGTSLVAAKPLRAGARYSVGIALGSNMGGVGHFLVSPDGQVTPIDNPAPGPGDPGPI